MGVDFYAHAILGVRVRRSQLFRTTTMRGCAHPQGQGLRYCPECGAAQRAYVEEPIAGYNRNQATIGDAHVYFDRNDDDGSCLAYIYHIAASSSSSRGGGHAGCHLSKELDAAKERLQKLLQPLGLWVEGNYGLWAVLQASY